MGTAAAHTPNAVRRMAGLSLIELLVTMTILALVIFASVPSMVSWSRNTQIRTVAETLMTGLAKARNEAVRRNTTVRFSLVTTSSSDISKLDATCALSSTASAWVVSLASPAGGCNAAMDNATSPVILDRQARSSSSTNVTVSAFTVTSAGACTTTTANQIAFNGFGRIASTTPIGCINIDHSQGSGNRALRIIINTGGTIRLCDPAVTDTSDPRIC